MPDSLNLTVQVPADEWAYTTRRVAYLEALVVRAVRDTAGAQEWWSAPELASLRLPGLPVSVAGIARKAALGFWRKRKVRGPDGHWRTFYHVTSFPPRAFDTMLGRVLDIEAGREAEDARPVLALRPAPIAPPVSPKAMPANAAPAWVLPLMRLMKGEAAGNLSRAWTALPSALPAGVALPAIEEAAEVLVSLGIVKG